MKEARPFRPNVRIFNRVSRILLGSLKPLLVLLWAMFALPLIPALAVDLPSEIIKKLVNPGLLNPSTPDEVTNRHHGVALAIIASALALIGIVIAVGSWMSDWLESRKTRIIQLVSLREYPESTISIDVYGRCVVNLRHENKEPLYARVFVRWREPKARRILRNLQDRPYGRWECRKTDFILLPQVIGQESQVTAISLVHLRRLKSASSKIWISVEVTKDNDAIFARSYQSPFDGSFAELQALQEGNSRRKAKRRASKR